MTVIDHLLDTVVHKKYILEVGKLMVDYLIRNNRDKEAEELCKRLIIHDDSKIRKDEMFSLVTIENKASMKDPSVLIDDKTRGAIELHWENNRHHPEHFLDYHDMKNIDIIEMVCDWYSRSKQYGTDFLDFVKTRQDNRFHFDENFFNKVYHYCLIIVEEDKNKGCN